MKQNNPKKILWVDDTPDELIGGRMLREVLHEIYDGRYELLEAKSGVEAERIVTADRKREIRLVLMDIEFRDEKGKIIGNGPDIAQDLFAIHNNLKFIILTRKTLKGQESNMGSAGGKVANIIKPNLAKRAVYFLNLSRSIVEDYENDNWEFRWAFPELYISNSALSFKEKRIWLGGKAGSVLDVALRNPNVSVANSVFEAAIGKNAASTDIPKALKAINDKLRADTNGNMWGILEKKVRGEIYTVVPRENITLTGGSTAACAPAGLATPTATSTSAAGTATPAVTSGAVPPGLDVRVAELEKKVKALENILRKHKKNP